MRKELISFEGKPTAKVIAIVTASFSLIFSVVGIPLLIISIFRNDWIMISMGMFYILAPIFYLTIGYLFTRLLIWLYNMIANKYGGIVYYIKDSE